MSRLGTLMYESGKSKKMIAKTSVGYGTDRHHLEEGKVYKIIGEYTEKRRQYYIVAIGPDQITWGKEYFEPVGE